MGFWKDFINGVPEYSDNGVVQQNNNQAKSDQEVYAQFREMLSSALDDERKPEYQLKMLNATLLQAAKNLPDFVMGKVSPTFNEVSRLSPEERNLKIISSLTRQEMDSVVGLSVKINTNYTDYSSFAVHELPGYIELHKVARELDISVDLKGLTSKVAGYQPGVYVDLSKDYEQGRIESTCGYPEIADLSQPALPPPAPPAPEKRATKPKNGQYRA